MRYNFFLYIKSIIKKYIKNYTVATVAALAIHYTIYNQFDSFSHYFKCTTCTEGTHLRSTFVVPSTTSIQYTGTIKNVIFLNMYSTYMYQLECYYMCYLDTSLNHGCIRGAQTGNPALTWCTGIGRIDFDMLMIHACAYGVDCKPADRNCSTNLKRISPTIVFD